MSRHQKSEEAKGERQVWEHRLLLLFVFGVATNWLQLVQQVEPCTCKYLKLTISYFHF